MNFIKKYFKIFIGVAVLILCGVIFFRTQQHSNLENGTLKDWVAAPVERKVAAMQIITASNETDDLLIACVDKMATLPDSAEMFIRDAASLCKTGIELKANL